MVVVFVKRLATLKKICKKYKRAQEKVLYNGENIIHDNDDGILVLEISDTT